MKPFSQWTTEEVLLHNIRIAEGKERGAVPVKIEATPFLEKALHRQIMDYCDAQWPRWKYRHARMDRATTEEKGVEDFTIFMPHNRTLHVECKQPGQKLTSEQQCWAKEMELLEHPVECIFSYQEFLTLIHP